MGFPPGGSRARKLPCGALGPGLGGIEGQPGLLDILAGAGSEHQVRVQCGIPPSEVAALDLGILRQPGLADALHGQRILLQSRGEGVLAGAGVLLVQSLAASQRSSGDGVRERLGLRLGARRGRQGSLGLGRGCSRGEKRNLLADGPAEILEGLLDVRGIVVGFVRVLRPVQRALMSATRRS